MNLSYRFLQNSYIFSDQVYPPMEITIQLNVNHIFLADVKLMVNNFLMNNFYVDQNYTSKNKLSELIAPRCSQNQISNPVWFWYDIKTSKQII